MNQRKKKIGLLPRIIVAMVAGIGAGLVFPDWAARIFVTFNGLFSQFLSFVIPLLIVGYVASAISDIGRRAGRMLILTVALAYGATFCAGMFSYGVSSWLFPSMIEPMNYIADSAATTDPQPFFTIELQPLMSVMTALVLAFVLGLCVPHVSPDGVLRKGVAEFASLIDMVIRGVVIPLLPVYIFGIFMGMTINGQVASVLITFVKIIAVIFVMHIVLLVAQYCVASLFARNNPFKALWTMMPAYFTALGTQSSAATIPVTVQQVQKLGVDRDVAGFVIPLGATIHMSGSTLKIVACAMALMLALGHTYSLSMFAGFIAMLGISIVAAPGVPGGAIMASLGLLSSILGFSDADNALMIALYIAMDSFGTACNVTGDGALAQIVNFFFGNRRGNRAENAA